MTSKEFENTQVLFIAAASTIGSIKLDEYIDMLASNEELAMAVDPVATSPALKYGRAIRNIAEKARELQKVIVKEFASLEISEIPN